MIYVTSDISLVILLRTITCMTIRWLSGTAGIWRTMPYPDSVPIGSPTLEALRTLQNFGVRLTVMIAASRMT